jgi:hypothetical protein
MNGNQAGRRITRKKERMRQMEEFQGVTAKGQQGENEGAFSARLSTFWTVVLRQNPELFEKVYAETTEFEEDNGSPTRKYAIEPDAVQEVTQMATRHGIDFLPVDPDDTYTRHEAVAPEWWQIEH